MGKQAPAVQIINKLKGNVVREHPTAQLKSAQHQNICSEGLPAWAHRCHLKLNALSAIFSRIFPPHSHTDALPWLSGFAFGGLTLAGAARDQGACMLYLASPPLHSELHAAVQCRDARGCSSPHLSTAKVTGSSLSLETLNIITKFNAFIIAQWISEQRS